MSHKELLIVCDAYDAGSASFSDVLQSAMALPMSEGELGDRLGASRSLVTSWATGKSEPIATSCEVAVANLRQVALAHNASVSLTFGSSTKEDGIGDLLKPLTKPFGGITKRVRRRVARFEYKAETLARKVLGLPEVDPHFPTYKRVVAVFNFSEEGFGFGEVAIASDAEGQTYIDDEYMGREAVKRYLCALVDQAILGSDRDPVRHKKYDAFMGRSCGQCVPSPEEEEVRRLSEETAMDVNSELAKFWQQEEIAAWWSTPNPLLGGKEPDHVVMENPDGVAAAARSAVAEVNVMVMLDTHGLEYPVWDELVEHGMNVTSCFDLTGVACGTIRAHKVGSLRKLPGVLAVDVL